MRDSSRDEESDYHELSRAVRDDAAVCDYCSSAFGVADAVADAGLATLAEYDGHSSIRSLVDGDYEIITFRAGTGLTGRPRERHRGPAGAVGRVQYREKLSSG